MASTLIIGASNNPARFAWKASSMLQNYGHQVIAYGIKKGDCAGIPITQQWPTDKVDTVTLYIGPHLQAPFVQQLLALKPKRIIFNPGTENPDVYPILEKNQIQCVEACTLVLLSTGQY